MENRRIVGYKLATKTTINRKKSTNPLAKISYKELQEIAGKLNLPMKLKVCSSDNFLYFTSKIVISQVSLSSEVLFPL